MRIKLYIVTYKAADLLERCLESIGADSKVFVTVTNNHGKLDCTLADEVLNNVCRPDWSTGHLARSWNQALMLGFKDLGNPDADIVCCCQDDTVFQAGWVDALVEHHKELDFVQFGHGDNFMSWTVDGVKKIGMWDERFCGLNYHEADYFLRARLCSECTINDHIEGHKRVYNEMPNDIIENIMPGCRSGHKDKKKIKKQSHSTNKLNKRFFVEKWGDVKYARNWDQVDSFPPPAFGNRPTYPYFEIPHIEGVG